MDMSDGPHKVQQRPLGSAEEPGRIQIYNLQRCVTGVTVMESPPDESAGNYSCPFTPIGRNLRYDAAVQIYSVSPSVYLGADLPASAAILRSNSTLRSRYSELSGASATAR